MCAEPGCGATDTASPAYHTAQPPPLNRNIEKYPEAETTPGIVVVRLDAPLFFANTSHFEGSIKRLVKAGQKEAAEAGCELGWGWVWVQPAARPPGSLSVLACTGTTFLLLLTSPIPPPLSVIAPGALLCLCAVEGVKFVVVDMTPVTRSDSSGAHFLYDLARDLKSQHGIQLVLCDPTDTVRSDGGAWLGVALGSQPRLFRLPCSRAWEAAALLSP